MSKTYVLLILPALLLAPLDALHAADAPQRADTPNIVFVLFDDMGWGQPQCDNPQSALRTPNLDMLAAQGMRFTGAHSGAAVCTPTRYGVLTGRYPQPHRTVRRDNGADHRAYAPLRESKRSIYEGGHRVPFVARWPGKVKPGSMNDHTICLNDLLATAAELVGGRVEEAARVGPQARSAAIAYRVVWRA
jgi:arylsulfatase A-like enzyme